jgi:hypothetical protein
MIKSIMDREKIEYEEITDDDIISAVAKQNKIMSMPFAEVDDFVMNTVQLQQYLRNVMRYE